MSLVSVDVGGTFTDVVSVRDGVIHTTKVPTDLVDSAAGVLRGATEVGVEDAVVFNHASTAGLNALLTRRLPKVGLLTTFGQRDVLDIGHSWRPLSAIADPRWRRSFGDANAPLIARYLRRTVHERLTVDGSVLMALDEEQAREEIRILGRCNVEGVAICLIHAWVNGDHERRLAELVREELGDIPVAMSHQVSPVAREYPRMSTTVVDALMRIIYGDYSERLLNGLRDMGFTGSLNYGDCAAMLAPATTVMERPSRIIFSGPAGGTSASAHFGNLIGKTNLICADVGGTSTDVSVVIDGRPIIDTTLELEPDMIVSTLSNEIASVGAGGGSLVTVGNSGEIRVGPESSGSMPGPACYGRGGTQPTMTDACLLLGILDPHRFLGGQATLDVEKARAAFESLDTPLSFDQRVRNAFEIGLNNIAEGILDILIRNGIDPRDYALIAYGAAGPMLLPALLEIVKAREVLIPPHPGLFSAIGLLSADMVFVEAKSRHLLLEDESAATIDATFVELEEQLRSQLGEQAEDATFLRSFDARIVGQAFETAFVDAPSGSIGPDEVAGMVATFHDVYESRSGNRFTGMDVQTVNLRVRAVIDMPKAEFPRAPVREPGTVLEPSDSIRILGKDSVAQPGLAYDRDNLCVGDVIVGPAVVHERLSTTYLPAGHRLTVGGLGEFVIDMEA